MSLPVVEPQEVGLDPRRLAVADAHVKGGAADGTYSAGVLLVARRGKIAYQSAFGMLAPGGSAPTRPDSIFDLASVTKPHVATALLTLVEDGKVTLGQELHELLPEAKGSPVEKLTIRLLATHTSGLVSWSPIFKIALGANGNPEPGSHDRMLAEILRTPLHNPPGTKYAYSDLGYMLIGEVVARASGMPLDQYCHSRVFAPLGMNDTGYLPAPTRKNRIAVTGNSSIRPGRLLCGEVHDENAHIYGGVAGHAGLFGTAPDLAILASALATNGEARGHRVLGLPTLRLVRTNQVDPAIGGHSIGWFAPPNGMLPRGDILPDSTFGHTGFTGTMVVIDPAHELVVILLTNRVVNPEDNGGVMRIRRRVLNAAASAIVK